MSLRCSIFGHRYGEVEVEQEREQAGKELVVTSREVKTCERCGERLIISENKEVTTVEAADDLPTGASAGPADGSTPTGTEAGESGAGTGTDSSGETGSGVEAGGPTVSDPDVSSSDGGAMGSTESSTASGPSAGAGKADVPPARKDDAVILDEEGEEVEPEEWSDGQQSGVDDDWEPETETADDPTESDRTSSSLTVPDGEFRCTECGFTTPVEGSSLRAGDFCPECHQGTLEHVSE